MEAELGPDKLDEAYEELDETRETQVELIVVAALVVVITVELIYLHFCPPSPPVW